MESYFIDENELLEEGKIDLRRYYRALIRRWWVVLLITLVIFVPYAIYLKSKPPVYEATALIRFNSYSGKDPGFIQSRKTELTSRSFAERVVAQLGLSMSFVLENKQIIQRKQIFENFSTSNDPVPGIYYLRLFEDQTYQLSIESEGALNSEELLQKGRISDISKNITVLNGLSFKLTQNRLQLPIEIPLKITAFRKSVKSFQNRINVNIDRSGSIMTVNLSDTDPNLVAEMTNSLAEIFIQESGVIRDKGTKGRLQILENSLNLVQKELNKSDMALKDYQEKYSTYLDTDQSKQINEVTNLERREVNLNGTITTLNDLLDKKEEESLSANGNSNEDAELNRRVIMSEIAGHGIFDDDATMLIYRQRLRLKEKDWKDIVSGTSSKNARAVAIVTEIKEFHSKIEVIARNKIQILEKEALALSQQINQARNRLKLLPTQKYQLAELSRNNQLLVNQYMELKKKVQEVRIAAAVTVNDAEILDSAQVPEFPTDRDKKKNAALGGILGLMCGIGIVLLFEFMDKSIKTADDVKRCLKLPILGTIPQIDFNDVYDFQDSEKVKQIDQQLVTHDYSPSPVGEAYRSLRTNLMFSKENGKIQSFVLTSNEPGDGKSFTAANLAITLAQLKSKTLLIDSDLRRGVLHNTFGVSKQPGFSNFLTSLIPLNSILNETHIPNLTLISCGSLVPNPSELLGSHQMQRFLDEVRRKFELVIFDTPPLNAATDAVVVGTQVDASVIVIRAGKTDRNLAKQKLELFTNVPAKVIGAILNGTTADMAHPGYSYYHY